MKHFIGCFPSQRLSGSMVEPVLYVLDLLFAQMFKATAFGDILPDKPVDILIDTPLPGTVGIAEIIAASKFLADVLMLCELQAVIACNGVQMFSVRSKLTNRFVCNDMGSFAHRK